MILSLDLMKHLIFWENWERIIEVKRYYNFQLMVNENKRREMGRIEIDNSSVINCCYFLLDKLLVIFTLLKIAI